MANDITIPATGTGTATPVVATEDIASSHYQVVKLAAGTAASTAKLGLIDDATRRYGIDMGAQIDREKLSQMGREFQEELALKWAQFSQSIEQNNQQAGQWWSSFQANRDDENYRRYLDSLQSQ